MTTIEGSDIQIAAEQGLQKLIAGNQRFMRGQANFPTVCKETLADLAREHRPFATILGCSDSRVPPELVFDANFGALFIVRVAGNVASPEVMGSLQYAGARLPTPLFVVLGHVRCRKGRAGVQARRCPTLLSDPNPGQQHSSRPARPWSTVIGGREAGQCRRSECSLVDAPEPRCPGSAGCHQNWLKIGGSGV
jgi:hypothetical protein